MICRPSKAVYYWSEVMVELQEAIEPIHSKTCSLRLDAYDSTIPAPSKESFRKKRGAPPS